VAANNLISNLAEEGFSSEVDRFRDWRLALGSGVQVAGESTASTIHGSKDPLDLSNTNSIFTTFMVIPKKIQKFNIQYSKPKQLEHSS